MKKKQGNLSGLQHVLTADAAHLTADDHWCSESDLPDGARPADTPDPARSMSEDASERPPEMA